MLQLDSYRSTFQTFEKLGERGRPMRKFCFSVTVLAGIVTQSGAAIADGCSIDGVKLECGSGDNRAVLAALASPKTSEALSKPLELLDNFNKPADLETFRKSIELSWRQANKAERAERRRMKRREISPEEFEKWSAGYDDARANYDAAMTLYRNLVWFGKNGKPAPQG